MKVVVVGAGQVGANLAGDLSQARKEVVVIDPKALLTGKVLRILFIPGAKDVLLFEDGKIFVVAFRAAAGGVLVEKPLWKLAREFDGMQIMVGAILRQSPDSKTGQKVVIPGGKDIIRAGDLVYFLATREALDALVSLQGEDIKPARSILIGGGGELSVRLAEALSGAGYTTRVMIGGCAGSTGGGIKVVRLQVMFKFAYRELLHIAHPRSISAVRYGHTVVPNSGVQAILGVVILFVGGFVVSALVMAAMGLDPMTATSSVAACIGNIGPGLAKVGPAENYFQIPQAGKWVLMLNMLAGRLEMFTVLVLLSPHFWRR